MLIVSGLNQQNGTKVEEPIYAEIHGIVPTTLGVAPSAVCPALPGLSRAKQERCDCGTLSKRV